MFYLQFGISTYGNNTSDVTFARGSVDDTPKGNFHTKVDDTTNSDFPSNVDDTTKSNEYTA